MNTSKVALCVLTGLFLSIATISAHDERVKKSDLPSAVQKTADEYSSGATVRCPGAPA
jgi:hypothetical protein